MRNYRVPYVIKSDLHTQFLEIDARNKEEAREVAVERLSSEPLLVKIGSTKFILDNGPERGY